MIRINLTRRRKVQRIKLARNQVVCAVLSLGFLLLALSLHNESLGARVGQTNLRAAQQKKKSDRLFKIKKETTRLKKKEAVIADLVKSRGSQIRVIDAIAKSAPPKKVWLTRIEINEDMVVINGNAMESGDAAIFMDRLKQTALFSDVHLNRLTQKSRPKTQLTLSVFQLTCRRLQGDGSKNGIMKHA